MRAGSPRADSPYAMTQHRAIGAQRSAQTRRILPARAGHPYPWAPMPATATRPRRSRVGLVFFLCVLALAAWEIVGRVSAPGVVTPLKFARGAWAMASGGSVAGADAPSDEEMAKMAYRPLPYVMYGLKPNWERIGKLRRTTNSLGFRGPEVEQPKPAGR